MAKHRDTVKRGTRSKPVGVYWLLNDSGWWIPVVYLGAKELPLEPRPEREFIEGEREAILVRISSEIAERLFGCPRYLFGNTGQIAKNPAWDELPTLVPEKPEPTPSLLDGKGKPAT